MDIGIKFKDLHSNLRREQPEHARFDIFINGQWILEQDYILEQQNKDILVKFIKATLITSLKVMIR